MNQLLLHALNSILNKAGVNTRGGAHKPVSRLTGWVALAAGVLLLVACLAALRG